MRMTGLTAGILALALVMVPSARSGPRPTWA